MIFNLVSNLAEGYDPDTVIQYNTSIAVSLRKALKAAGHGVNLVKDHDDSAPAADHTIVLSNWAMKRIKGEPEYVKMLTEATLGNLCLWLDAAFEGLEIHYDLVLTVTPPFYKSKPKFKWVGYAADQELFYPEQATRPTAFIDSFMYGWYQSKHDYVYDIIAAVLDVSGVAQVQPIKQYNKGPRIPHAEMAALMRQCHYAIVTQIGNWALTNIELAACGALLVIHESMKQEAWPCELNHVYWDTQSDLEQILGTPVDIQANRAKACEQSWGAVVARIEEHLQ